MLRRLYRFSVEERRQNMPFSASFFQSGRSEISKQYIQHLVSRV